jgi:hypothetical protein
MTYYVNTVNHPVYAPVFDGYSLRRCRDLSQDIAYRLREECQSADHPIGKPKQQMAVLEHNYEWFSQYIWGEQSPDMAPAGTN